MLPLLALIELVACVALLALFAHTLAARRTATLLRAAYRNRRSGAVPNSVSNLPNALLVIAHPDDEVMFFGPTILTLSQYGRVQFHVLCFTNGEHDAPASVRRSELVQSCAVLAIPKDCVHFADDSAIRDGPDETWNAKVAATYVLRLLRLNKFDFLFTFDERGVSGHANHIDCHRICRVALATHAMECLVERGVRPPLLAYRLESVSLVRKYLGPLDAPASLATRGRLLETLFFTWRLSLGSLSLVRARPHARTKEYDSTPSLPPLDRELLVAGPLQVLRIWRAMWQHRSQLLTARSAFRFLYLLASRYVSINTYQPLTAHTIH